MLPSPQFAVAKITTDLAGLCSVPSYLRAKWIPISVPPIRHQQWVTRLRSPNLPECTEIAVRDFPLVRDWWSGLVGIGLVEDMPARSTVRKLFFYSTWSNHSVTNGGRLAPIFRLLLWASGIFEWNIFFSHHSMIYCIALNKKQINALRPGTSWCGLG